MTRDVRQTAQGWRGEGLSEVVQCCGVTTNTLDHEALRLVGALGGNVGSPAASTLTPGGKYSVAVRAFRA